MIHLEIESGHWIVQSMDLEREVTRLKQNYAALKDEFNHGAALAQKHCPKPPLGHSVFEGIPLLADEVKRLNADVTRLQNGLAQVMRATNPGIDYDPAYAILDVQSALSRLEWLHDYIRGRRGVTNPEQSAQDERAAIVAWLTKTIDNSKFIAEVDPFLISKALLDCIERGDHWPEGGAND